MFSTLKKILDIAVSMQYLESNVSTKVKALPKGKAQVSYWTKHDFKKVINHICIDDPYENLCLVILGLYYNSGVRVNESTAIFWSDIDFKKKNMRVTHMLILKSKTNLHRQSYTKTDAGSRIISMDDDTIKILKAWKKRQEDTVGSIDFIFNYDGSPMIKSTIDRIVKRDANLANVPEIEAKGLRH